MNIQTVHSSHGDVKIDSEGHVLSVEEDEGADPGYLTGIRQFDLVEYKNHYGSLPDHGEYDILDLGYWTVNGYEEPEHEWRVDIAAGTI